MLFGINESTSVASIAAADAAILLLTDNKDPDLIEISFAFSFSAGCFSFLRYFNKIFLSSAGQYNCRLVFL